MNYLHPFSKTATEGPSERKHKSRGIRAIRVDLQLGEHLPEGHGSEVGVEGRLAQPMWTQTTRHWMVLISDFQNPQIHIILRY